MKKSFVWLQLAAVIAAGFTSVFAVRDVDMDQQVRAFVKPGKWGGRGIALVVEKNSVTIEMDCAKGTISSRLRIGKRGRLSAAGLLTRTGPGPIRLDSPPKPQPIRLDGSVTGKQMRLKITIAESGDVVGSYILERGKQGELVRCF